MIEVLWGLRRYYGYIVLLMIIVGLMIANSSLQGKLADCELRAERAESSVRAQNVMIDLMAKEAAVKKEAGEKAMKAAKVVDKAHQQKAITILREVPTADDECVATLELLKEYQR